MNAVLNAFAPFQDAAVVLVSYLVTALWMGVAIAALTALLLRVWKPLDAATRYVVWYVALIAVVLGPLATVVAMHHAHRSAFDAGGVSGDGRATPSRATGSVYRRPQIAIPPLVADGVAAAWLLVVLAGALRVGAAAAVLVRLKRDSLPLSPDRRAALPLWQSHANVAGARPARLCVSDRVEVPVAVGLFDSMVVFPEHVVDGFEPGDIDRFVLHELAHLNRRDDWTAAIQRVVQLVLFVNPAVHAIACRLDLERELACDDCVVAATFDARSYAIGLTRMAEATPWPHRGIVAPAVFATRNHLSLRVEQLLSARRFTAPRIAYAPAGVVLAASLGVLATAAQVAPAFALTGVRASSRVDTAAVVIVERDGNVTKSVRFEHSNAVNVQTGAKTLLERARALENADEKTLPGLLKALLAEAEADGNVARRLVYAPATAAPKKEASR